MIKRFGNISLSLVALSVGIWACAPQTITQQKQVIDYSYQDDISQYLPEIESQEKAEKDSDQIIQNQALSVSFDARSKLNAVMDSMLVRNDSIRLIDGYTILVYSGNDEIQAGRVRNRLFDLVPDEEAQFSYKLPTYFVKVGQFFQQIEAQPLYKKITQYYPTASIVPEKFPLENEDQ